MLAILTILNIMIILAFALSIRRMITTLYFAVNYLLLINPAVIELLIGATHPLHRLEPSVYVATLGFVAAFNVILGLSFVAFTRLVPRGTFFTQFRIVRLSELPQSTMGVVIASAIFLTVAVAAKIGLGNLGAYRMLDETSASPILQAIKVAASFDLFALIFLGEFKARQPRGNGLINATYIIVIAAALFFAFASGSRSQTLIVLLIAAISHREFIRGHLLLTTILVVLAVPISAIVFPFLAYYRNSGYQLDAAMSRIGTFWVQRNDILLDVLTTRLNYYEIIAHAIDYVQRVGPQGGAIYWNNILGIVPRLIWPDKPQIQNNSQELGHMLGLLTWNDQSTSIGLRVIGESFFEFGWFGLLLAPIQALLFVFLYRNFDYSSNPALYTVYIYTGIYLVSRDGYFALLPGLILLGFGFVAFFATMTMVLPKTPRYAV